MILKRTNLDMTEGNALKNIIIFTLPLLLGNVFQQLYNIVDSMVVGNFVGDEALAAVSSSGSLINLLIGLVQGITVGAGIVIAQYFGAKDNEKMRKSIHTTVIFSFILGIAMTVFGFFMSGQLLIWMKTDESVLSLSTIYFKVYFLGCIFTLMYNAGSAIFRAVGDSTHPLYYLIVSSIINVLLDLLFVGLFKWGVIGAGVATIIAQAVSMLITFYRLIFIKTDYQIRIKDLRLDYKELKKIVAYGLPTGIQNSIISLSNVFIQSNINSFGPMAQAGCGAYSKIEGFATLPSGSFSMALSTFVGQNIGAAKKERAYKGGMLGLLCSMLVTEFLGLMLFIFAPNLIWLFSRTDEVIKIGVLQARTVVLFYFLLSFSHGMSGILRGAGYSKIPMFTMIICWVLVRITLIPVALKVPGWNTIRTIFWFYPFTWSLSFVALSIVFIYVFLKMKKEIKNNMI
jgi:MATE efflux family protein